MDDIDLNQRVFEEEESIYEDIQISPKRKSGDRFDENDENIQLNNAQENNNIKGEDVNLIKKIKFSTSDVSSSAVSNKKPAIVKRAVQIPSAPITKPVRIGSSLPRYNQVPVKKATSIPIKSAVATPIVTVNIGTKSNEMIASPEKTSSNENKMIASEAIMSATRVGCNGLMKRLKDVVVSHSSEGVVKGFFEKTFTSTEESFTSKLVVRTKNKWDIKEKVKKQEAAFIEVREMLVNHFQELAIIRNTCLTHDERVNALLSDTLDALQNKDTQIDELAASKITLSSDHTHMSERLREVEFKLKIASEEVEPCKMELSRLKEKLVEEEVKSQLLNTRVTELVTQHASLEIENKDLLLAQQSASFAQKDVHEKVCGSVSTSF